MQSAEVWQSHAFGILDSHLLAIPFTRLGLHIRDKQRFYNKYQEAAALLHTFPAEGKSMCPRGMSGELSLIYEFIINR